jgi:transcription initiation factor IIF auxiliary subunit
LSKTKAVAKEFRFDNYARAIVVSPERRSRASADADWYEWRVFMAEPRERLDLVDHVEYRLHETFPDPIRLVSNRDSGFALDSSGWGEFLIVITISMKDGTEHYVQYQLDLNKPPPPSQ